MRGAPKLDLVEYWNWNLWAALYMDSILTMFDGMADCMASVVLAGAKKGLISLGWAEEPQPQLAGDKSTLPKLGMGHNGRA